MALVTTVLVLGIRESARTNALLVIIKVAVVVFVIVVGCGYVQPRQLDAGAGDAADAAAGARVMPELVKELLRELAPSARTARTTLCRTGSWPRAIGIAEWAQQEAARLEQGGPSCRPPEAAAMVADGRESDQPDLPRRPTRIAAVVEQLLPQCRAKAAKEETDSGAFWA